MHKYFFGFALTALLSLAFFDSLALEKGVSTAIVISDRTSAEVHVQVITNPPISDLARVFLCPLFPEGDSLLAMTNENGFLSFTGVTTGNYRLWVNQPAFVNYRSEVVIEAPSTSFVVPLTPKCNPITGLSFNSQSLNLTWDAYNNDTTLFFDDFSSGNFSTQGWSVTSEHWHFDTIQGNPPPAAFFGFPPISLNYDGAITSPWIWGTGADTMQLHFQWGIDNFATYGHGYLDVEIDDGTVWKTLKQFDREILEGGHWATENLDISAYRYTRFRIRFRMYGPDSSVFDKWHIENVEVVAKPTIAEPSYNIFFNNIQIAYTVANQYTVPSGLVQYGEQFLLCVSPLGCYCFTCAACDSVTSLYLPPPIDFSMTHHADTVVLSWIEPDSVLAELIHYSISRNDTVVAEVFPPDTSFWGVVPYPGNHCYAIKAWYNLEPVGFPPDSLDASLPAGPVCDDFYFGLPLPFVETWSADKTTINNWEVSDGIYPWHLSYQEGLNAPCIAHEPAAIESNYSYSISSPWINTKLYECSDFELSFWVKFHLPVPFNSAYLTVEAWTRGSWMNMGYLSNIWPADQWVKHQATLDTNFNEGTRIRINAFASFNQGLTYWYVDSISLTLRPHAPAELTAANNSPWLVALQWLPVSCDGSAFSGQFQAYHVFRDGNFIGETLPGTTTFNDSLVSGGEHCYTVKAAYLMPEGTVLSEPSNQACLLVTALPNNSSQSFRVWPNPAGNRLYITAESGVASFGLMNLPGQEIFVPATMNDGTTEVNLENVSSGLYFLIIRTSDGHEAATKIVIKK